MNNEKGFFQVILMIMIIGAVIVASLEWAREEKIGKQLGEIVSEFKESSEQVTQFQPETKTVTIDRSGVNCLDGKKTITINGVVYHLGTIKNTWGDLEAVDCQ